MIILLNTLMQQLDKTNTKEKQNVHSHIKCFVVKSL